MASGQAPQPSSLAGAATTPATALTASNTIAQPAAAAAAAAPAANSNALLAMPSASEIVNDWQSHYMAMHRNLQLLVQRDSLLTRHLRQSEEARKQQAEQLTGDLARSKVLRKDVEERLQEATRREFTAQQRVRALEQQLAEAERKLQHAGMIVELDSAFGNGVNVDDSDKQQIGLGTEDGSVALADNEDDTQIARQAVQQLLELYSVLQKLMAGFCDGFAATMKALAEEYPKFSPEYWLPATDMKYMQWLMAFRLGLQQAESRGNEVHTTGGQAHCQQAEGRSNEQHTHPANAEASVQATSRDAAVQTTLDMNKSSKVLVQLQVHLREQEQLKKMQRQLQQRQALLLPKPPGAQPAAPFHAQPSTSTVRPTMQPASPRLIPNQALQPSQRQMQDRPLQQACMQTPQQQLQQQEQLALSVYEQAMVGRPISPQAQANNRTAQPAASRLNPANQLQSQLAHVQSPPVQRNSNAALLQHLHPQRKTHRFHVVPAMPGAEASHSPAAEQLPVTQQHAQVGRVPTTVTAPATTSNTRPESGGSLQPTDAQLAQYQQYCSLQDMYAQLQRLSTDILPTTQPPSQQQQQQPVVQLPTTPLAASNAHAQSQALHSSPLVSTAPQSPAEVADAIALPECAQQDGTHAPTVAPDTGLEDGEIGKQPSCKPPVSSTEGGQPEPVMDKVPGSSSHGNQEELAAAVHVKQEFESESRAENSPMAEPNAKSDNPANEGRKDVVCLSSSSDSEGSDGLNSSASARKRPRAW